jgi:DNA end-binding protein Ku
MAVSVWKGSITFGLISIPVRLFRAARSERVPLRELRRTQEIEPPPEPEKTPIRIDRRRVETEPPPPPEPVFEPVRHVSVGQFSEERAPASAITKGYEYERGQYVTVSAEELRAIAPETSSSMEISEFVHLAEVDPVYFEASYYVKPEETGRKPYALLYEAMREAGFAAIAQFAMHRRERVAMLRPGPSGLIAHTMYFTSEVRSDQEVHADKSLVSPKELAMAKTLVGALAGPFDASKYRDTYRERLEALIAGKVAGKPAAVVAAAPRAQPVTDIMEALRKSIEAVKKPQAKEGPRTPRRTASKQ